MNPISRSGVASAVATPTEPLAATLSPDAVLNHCVARMNAIDGVIQQRFAEQKARGEVMQQTSRLIATLNRNPNGQAGGEALSRDRGAMDFHRGQAADLRAQLASVTDPALRDEIAGAYRMITGTDLVGRDGAVVPLPPDGMIPIAAAEVKGLDREQWARNVERLKQLQDGASTSNELAMIQLQSMLSQRQLAVQITTQMMAAMAESSKSIVANIRG